MQSLYFKGNFFKGLDHLFIVLAVLDCRLSSPMWMLSMVLEWRWRKIDSLGDR